MTDEESKNFALFFTRTKIAADSPHHHALFPVRGASPKEKPKQAITPYRRPMPRFAQDDRGGGFANFRSAKPPSRVYAKMREGDRKRLSEACFGSLGLRWKEFSTAKTNFSSYSKRTAAGHPCERAVIMAKRQALSGLPYS